jgi:hypothetical protein
MKVATIFFGISRAATLTRDSIQKNLFLLPQNSTLTFTSFASLNLPKKIHNPRAGEYIANVDQSENFSIPADYFLLRDQSDSDISFWLKVAQSKQDTFGDGWVSVTNLFHQLLSLRRAWSGLHALLPEGFDYYLFLRPDLLYLDPINVPELIRSVGGSDGIAIPAWHSFGGLNDRFAFAGAQAARDYANRLELSLTYCEKYPMHGETFLAFALDRARSKVCEFPVRGLRVRSNRLIKREQFDVSVRALPKQASAFSFSPENDLVFLEPRQQGG